MCIICIWCLIHSKSSGYISYYALDSCQRLTQNMLLFRTERQTEDSATQYSSAGRPLWLCTKRQGCELELLLAESTGKLNQRTGFSQQRGWCPRPRAPGLGCLPGTKHRRGPGGRGAVRGSAPGARATRLRQQSPPALSSPPPAGGAASDRKAKARCSARKGAEGCPCWDAQGRIQLWTWPSWEAWTRLRGSSLSPGTPAFLALARAPACLSGGDRMEDRTSNSWEPRSGSQRSHRTCPSLARIQPRAHPWPSHSGARGACTLIGQVRVTGYFWRCEPSRNRLMMAENWELGGAYRTEMLLLEVAWMGAGPVKWWCSLEWREDKEAVEDWDGGRRARGKAISRQASVDGLPNCPKRVDWADGDASERPCSDCRNWPTPRRLWFSHRSFLNISVLEPHLQRFYFNCLGWEGSEARYG